MTKPIKIWLWLVTLVSAAQCIWSLMGAFGPTFALSLAFAAAYAAYTVAGLLMLFPKKKAGMVIFILAAVVNCILYAIHGGWANVVGEALATLVTWLVVRRCWILFD